MFGVKDVTFGVTCFWLKGVWCQRCLVENVEGVECKSCFGVRGVGCKRFVV